MTQLALGSVAVEFGATTVFRDVSFTVARGERWGIVGRNGTGKTTLFRVITGEMAPTSGGVSRAPGLRIAHLEQHRDFGSARNVWDAAAAPFADLIALERSLHEQAEGLAAAGERATAQALARYDRDLERFGREGGYAIASRVDAVLHGLGFDPNQARSRSLERLSGGERGRLGLVRQLVAPADLLLLDEPTNHLDLETSRWLEEYLREIDETVILISHDRAFLERVADHVLHFEGGTATPYVGGFSAFVRQRDERRLAQRRAFDQQRRVIAEEEDYIRRNIAGQNSAQAKGRRKRLERLPRLSPPPSEADVMGLRLESGERSGDRVLAAERVEIAVAMRTEENRLRTADSGLRTENPPDTGRELTLIEDFSAVVSRGDVIGLIGANGSGKSTLLRSIEGEHPVAAGELRLGASTTMAYYRQDLTQVPMDRRLYDIIQDLRPRWERRQIQAHLGRFGFSGDSVQRIAGTLSGGEQARVALAMIVLAHANFLIFDEPTNHLDVESIEALEDALDAYDGTVLLVSHDRALLRALVTRVWSLENRRIGDYDGTFAEWEDAMAERERAELARSAAAEADRRAKERENRQRAERAREGDRAVQREQRRAVERAEAEVVRLEARLTELTHILEDVTLYTSADGAERAGILSAEMAAVRQALEVALERWEKATRTDDT